MNLKSGLALIYIDADNDKIVKYTVPSHGNSDCKLKAKNKLDKDYAHLEGPNRITRVDAKRVAIIYKKSFDIIIFNVQNMQEENSYVVDNRDLEVNTVQYFIEGFSALSPDSLILSNKERLFSAKLDSKKKRVSITTLAPSIHKFDTARRLTCVSIPTADHLSSSEKMLKGNLKAKKKIVFIADENDKTVTSIEENGRKICELKGHNRGLQNVRGIAATENYVFAATSAGISVYTHEHGRMENEYKMLVEYNKHVDHTRGLCIETVDSLTYLAMTCIIKGTDVIAVFAFETSDLENFH